MQGFLFANDFKKIVILNDQQCITIAKETIFVFDRFLICFHDEIISGKSTGHDQQTCFWQRKLATGFVLSALPRCGRWNPR